MDLELTKKIQQLPQTPGSYLFRNCQGRVIYVGKAKNLKSRVSSYFHTGIEKGSKTGRLVSQINDVDYIETVSELEAIILEAELIRKYKPRYNIILKDDKSQLYIVIRNESLNVAGKKMRLAKIITSRKTDLKKGDTTFGPYPDSTTARNVVRTIRKIFPFRDCSPAKFSRYAKLNRDCLCGHIGVCGGPCINISLEDIRSYRTNISRVKKLLSGDSMQVLRDLNKRMKSHSVNLEYEQAKKYRDLLEQFNYVRQRFRDASDYIRNPYLVEDLAKQAMEDLYIEVPVLESRPIRIESYDISNISGKEAVGSMVVAVDGRVDKSEYKKFRIRLKDTPDDYSMMKEVLKRRLKRENSHSRSMKKWGRPDLILVDGGKAQVSAGTEAMMETGVSIPIVGLAKKKETLVYREKESGQHKELNLSKDSQGMKLLIVLRDEAHRFAQSYHHLLRKKKIRQ